MIGREGELTLVESFLEDAGPGTHALFLLGEAGIGKTTIWQAALDAAAKRGYRVVVTRPTEAEARLPFAGLNDLFGDLVDAGPELPPPQQTALDVALMRASVEGEPIQPLALSLAVLELMRSASSKRAARASPGGTCRNVGLRSGRAALPTRRGPDAHGRLQRIGGACPRGVA